MQNYNRTLSRINCDKGALKPWKIKFQNHNCQENNVLKIILLKTNLLGKYLFGILKTWKIIIKKYNYDENKHLSIQFSKKYLRIIIAQKIVFRKIIVERIVFWKFNK